MKFISRLTAIGLFAFLAGCGTFTAESFLNEELPSGDSFSQCLAREYQDRANSEAYVDCNWADTAMIVEKGRLAASGQQVLPYAPSNFPVLPEALPELQDARTALMAALDNGGRSDRGCACAAAQRYYDGWVEQASDNKLGVDGAYFKGPGGPVQPERVAAEKAAFLEALAACAPPAPAMVGPWTIYFGFDRYNLTSEAQAVVNEIVGSVGQPVAVVGHTDTSGSKAYNQALGQRRANAVANAVQSAGGSVCAASSDGENDLAVPTADGVREPLNRRAVVMPCN